MCVQSGVNADAISHEDYFNAPGETYSVKLDTAGAYSFYCEPHQGAGMTGERRGGWGRKAAKQAAALSCCAACGRRAGVLRLPASEPEPCT